MGPELMSGGRSPLRVPVCLPAHLPSTPASDCPPLRTLEWLLDLQPHAHKQLWAPSFRLQIHATMFSLSSNVYATLFQFIIMFQTPFSCMHLSLAPNTAHTFHQRCLRSSFLPALFPSVYMQSTLCHSQPA
ncbi:hypothetical protein ABPG75_013599 [Micractinium tetrahymenae]